MFAPAPVRKHTGAIRTCSRMKFVPLLVNGARNIIGYGPQYIRNTSMKVKELITLLQTQDPEAVVFADVFEDQGEILDIYEADEDSICPYAKGESIISLLKFYKEQRYIKDNNLVRPQGYGTPELKAFMADVRERTKDIPLPSFICLMTR